MGSLSVVVCNRKAKSCVFDELLLILVLPYSNCLHVTPLKQDVVDFAFKSSQLVDGLFLTNR